MGKPTGNRRRVCLHFAAGFAAAALLLVVGEAGLRVAPPRTIQPYLPDDDRPGPFRSDPYYGVQYASWEAFHGDYADGLKPHEFLFDTARPAEDVGDVRQLVRPRPGDARRHGPRARPEPAHLQPGSQ